MSSPNRCQTCGTVLGHLYKQFDEERKSEEITGKQNVSKNDYFSENVSYEKIFEKLGIDRTKYCCRKYFVARYDIHDVLFGETF
jgi:DNA-directed RNA polymerase subunit N (RpoN/RPB10)